MQIINGSYTFNRCKAWRTVPGDDNPRPPEITVELPDGTKTTGDKLNLISSSQMESEKSCRRKWGLYAIDKVPRPETKAQALGKLLHKQLENWLSKYQPPSSSRLTDCQALSQFPLPRTPGLQTEQVFVIEITKAGTDYKVYFWGFKDVEVVVIGRKAEVYDLKSTKSFDWKKTVEVLSKDIQANIYAFDTLLASGCDQAFLQWVYVRTTGAPASDPTPRYFDKKETTDFCTQLAERSFELIEFKLRGRAELADAAAVPEDTRTNKLWAMRFEGNPNACGEYGGCEYKHLCTDLKPGSALRARRNQRNLEKDRHAERLGKPKPERKNNMGLLDKVRKSAPVSVSVTTGQNIGDTKPVAVAQAAPVAPAPAPTPEVSQAEPPKKGGLGAALAARKMAPAGIPTGVVAADAKPPPPKPSEVPVELAPAAVLVTEKAPSAATKAPKAAKKTQTSGQFILVLNAFPHKGVSEDVDSLIAPARAKVEEESGMPYKLIEYNKGGAFIAAQMESDWTEVNGIFHVLTQVVDSAILEFLIRKADVVLSAGR